MGQKPPGRRVTSRQDPSDRAVWKFYAATFPHICRTRGPKDHRTTTMLPKSDQQRAAYRREALNFGASELI